MSWLETFSIGEDFVYDFHLCFIAHKQHPLLHLEMCSDLNTVVLD